MLLAGSRYLGSAGLLLPRRRTRSRTSLQCTAPTPSTTTPRQLLLNIPPDAHRGDALLVVAVPHDVRVPDAGQERGVGDALDEVALVAAGRHAPVVAGQHPGLGPLHQAIGPVRLGSGLGSGLGSVRGRDSVSRHESCLQTAAEA